MSYTKYAAPRHVEEEDDKHTYLDWHSITTIIKADNLHLLTRSPSQNRLYAKWCDEIRQQYGSVATYMLEVRLKWDAIPSNDKLLPPRFVVQSTTPYAEREDYLVLINDWPYGFAASITHICIWLKTPLPCDDKTGALSTTGHVMTEDFVQQHIARPLDLLRESVAWFKNPFNLQSIRFVDHVHVLLRDVDLEKLDALLDTP